MPDVRVTNWADLHERLYADAWNDLIRRFRTTYAYRGVWDAGADLVTSLARIGGDYARQEAHILRAFRKYGRHYTDPGDSVWNWLALAQHHGLPTRMLDWTYSPYVALHFVTEDTDTFDCDGVIWCVDYRKAHALLPAVLRQLTEQEGVDIFTAEMLDQVATSMNDLDLIGGGGAGGGDTAFAVFTEPPSLDARIVNQFALFSMMTSPTARLDHWLADRPDLFHRLIIPADLKWEIRDKLDQANITERVLFPGLDGLSKYLTRYYTPRTEVDGQNLAPE
jgi:hypothetical protein